MGGGCGVGEGEGRRKKGKEGKQKNKIDPDFIQQKFMLKCLDETRRRGDLAADRTGSDVGGRGGGGLRKEAAQEGRKERETSGRQRKEIER